MKKLLIVMGLGMMVLFAGCDLFTDGTSSSSSSVSAESWLIGSWLMTRSISTNDVTNTYTMSSPNTEVLLFKTATLDVINYTNGVVERYQTNAVTNWSLDDVRLTGEAEEATQISGDYTNVYVGKMDNFYIKVSDTVFQITNINYTAIYSMYMNTPTNLTNVMSNAMGQMMGLKLSEYTKQ